MHKQRLALLILSFLGAKVLGMTTWITKTTYAAGEAAEETRCRHDGKSRGMGDLARKRSDFTAPGESGRPESQPPPDKTGHAGIGKLCHQ